MTDFSKHFVSDKRDNGETFTTLKDDRPEWLQDAVREAHQTDLPNDWIYGECKAAVEAFDEGSLTDEDSIHEYADGRVDIYTKDVYQWAADMCLSSTFSYAEEEAEGMGVDLKGGVVKLLQTVQYCAISTIARTMLEACTKAERGADGADGEDES
jgi:hypothetical protein